MGAESGIVRDAYQDGEVSEVGGNVGCVDGDFFAIVPVRVIPAGVGRGRARADDTGKMRL